MKKNYTVKKPFAILDKNGALVNFKPGVFEIEESLLSDLDDTLEKRLKVRVAKLQNKGVSEEAATKHFRAELWPYTELEIIKAQPRVTAAPSKNGKDAVEKEALAAANNELKASAVTPGPQKAGLDELAEPAKTEEKGNKSTAKQGQKA